MRKATIILAGATAVSILTTAALAQQNMTGTITKIDRLNGTISIQQTQSGTVGAGSGAIQEFKVTDVNKLEPFHAGDKVNFSAAEGGGTKTITDLKKQ
ncbi:copper-binding protein [Bradyrhizobium sp. BRP22]|uniref:copper-binding protein n=1 Tax=Bradyrhizobium sp. BRP22 TaxID=2793821 RepID=UPI001CD47F25|nr:copper-binding protein [Bradyrhizobium sp. BRP22]MCA1455705.1 copper-binding protein [Bradyrhizobium sp. BRP22]